MKTLEIPITDLETIKKLIPHREPMVMVGSLLEFEDGKARVGFSISKDNLYVVNGEFSETGLIEHMAQAAALYIGFKNHAEQENAKEGFIASIKKLKLKELPKVGQEIEPKVSIINEIMLKTTVKVSTFSTGVEIANAQMNTVLKVDE